jgi:hypothetical protein
MLNFVPVYECMTGIFMGKIKTDYTFWTKYKRFATTEVLMYLIMVIGILVGILIFS